MVQPERPCCIKGCKSHRNNKVLNFYTFPSPKYPNVLARRKQWIQTIVKCCNYSKDWEPMQSTVICSKHFIGGQKSDDPLHPAYIPTIFTTAMNKKNRLDHNYHKLPETIDQENSTVKEEPEESVFMDTTNLESVFVKEEFYLPVDFSCQADMYCDVSGSHNVSYMICNQTIENGLCCAETQAQLLPVADSKIRMPKNEISSDKSFDHLLMNGVQFQGITSINFEKNLIQMCGVSFKVFHLLLKSLPKMDNTGISDANRLLIFLMKMKQGMSYSALAILFGCEPTTISKICLFALQYFANFPNFMKIEWPDREAVRKSSKEPFKKMSPNCRAVLGYIDVQLEVPDDKRERLLFYTANRDKFAYKFLLACAPDGIITYKSTCFLHKGNELSLQENEFLNLLQAGDTLLTNEESPNIRNQLLGKKIYYFSPPFHDAGIDNLGVHVKECINTIRCFKILSSLPNDLILQVDQVVHVCCCLVNWQIQKK